MVTIKGSFSTVLNSSVEILFSSVILSFLIAFNIFVHKDNKTHKNYLITRSQIVNRLLKRNFGFRNSVVLQEYFKPPNKLVKDRNEL